MLLSAKYYLAYRLSPPCCSHRESRGQGLSVSVSMQACSGITQKILCCSFGKFIRNCFWYGSVDGNLPNIFIYYTRYSKTMELINETVSGLMKVVHENYYPPVVRFTGYIIIAFSRFGVTCYLMCPSTLPFPAPALSYIQEPNVVNSAPAHDLVPGGIVPSTNTVEITNFIHI